MIFHRKLWVYQRLQKTCPFKGLEFDITSGGMGTNPVHGKTGCVIGDRLEWIQSFSVFGKFDDFDRRIELNGFIFGHFHPFHFFHFFNHRLPSGKRLHYYGNHHVYGVNSLYMFLWPFSMPWTVTNDQNEGSFVFQSHKAIDFRQTCGCENDVGFCQWLWMASEYLNIHQYTIYIYIIIYIYIYIYIHIYICIVPSRWSQFVRKDIASKKECSFYISGWHFA